MTAERCCARSASTSDPGDELTKGEPRRVTVSWQRLPGWVTRFEERHQGTAWTVSADLVEAVSDDGAWAQIPVPFPPLADCSLDGLSSHLAVPREFGVVLVRRGGFAVAHARDSTVLSAKVGRRHVQGRTKAGGWSQQRFARRRDNQARQAFDAAAKHTADIVAPVAAGLTALVVGGDRAALDHVLGSRRLRALARVQRCWVDVSGDPRRQEIEAALAQARSVVVSIDDPTVTT